MWKSVFSYGDWFEEVRRKLINPTLVKSVAPAEGFQGILRPYQHTGLSWLAFLDSLGFGACLADDMGLGKKNYPDPRFFKRKKKARMPQVCWWFPPH